MQIVREMGGCKNTENVIETPFKNTEKPALIYLQPLSNAVILKKNIFEASRSGDSPLSNAVILKKIYL